MGRLNLDKKTIIIITIGLLIIGVFCWYMFGRGIPNTGSGIDATRTDLQSVGDKQQSAIGRLDNIETGLAQTRQKLEKYQQDLATLQVQLQKLRVESTAAKANESLSKYEKEVKSEIRGLNWQRNILLLAAGVLVFR